MTPIPDHIAEAVDAYGVAIAKCAIHSPDIETVPQARARLDALIGEVVAECDRYQELRKLIDGGSESMTHVDALSTIGQLQEALEERDRLRGQLEKERARLRTKALAALDALTDFVAAQEQPR